MLSTIFSLFLHLNSERHNLVIELCRAFKIIINLHGYLVNLRTVFVAIELLAFFNNAKSHLYCSRELSVFGL